MQIIRNNSEKALLVAIAELRKDKPVWWGLWIRLTQLKLQMSETALKTLIDAIKHLSGHGDWSIYFLDSGDAVLLTQHIPVTLCNKTVHEISLVLTDDAAACGKITEQGNDLCTVYKSADDLTNLHHSIIELSSSKPKITQQNLPTPATLLNAGFFNLSVQQRKERKRLCVLIVEDQSFSRQLVSEIVGRNFDKVSAADGVEALKLYEAHAPDVVFLDIDIPLINGQAVLNHITSVDSNSFVVMLTASQTQEEVERALKNGAMGYIVKPFTKQKIDKYLGMYQKHFAA